MVLIRQGRIIRAVTILVFSVVSFAASGCGGKGDVTGSITYKGKKVTTGTVTLIGSDGMAYHAVISDDGSYTVRDVPSGPAKVAVHSPNPNSASGQFRASKDRKGAGLDPEAGQMPLNPTAPPAPLPDKKSEAPPPAAKNWFPIPEHLGDPDQSRITFDVKRGPNTFDIPLDKVQ